VGVTTLTLTIATDGRHRSYAGADSRLVTEVWYPGHR
jgi:hypothetical protein